MKPRDVTHKNSTILSNEGAGAKCIHVISVEIIGVDLKSEMTSALGDEVSSPSFQGEALALRPEPEVLQSSRVALRMEAGVSSVIGVGVLERKALRRTSSRVAGAPFVSAKRNLQSPAVQFRFS